MKDWYNLFQAKWYTMMASTINVIRHGGKAWDISKRMSVSQHRAYYLEAREGVPDIHTEYQL
jgi:hypothetical protein